MTFTCYDVWEYCNSARFQKTGELVKKVFVGMRETMYPLSSQLFEKV